MARLFAPGWRSLLVALAAFLFLPSAPTALRSIMPITETWVLVAAGLAVCAALGWWNGGGPAAAVLAAVCGGIALGAPLGLTPASAYPELARGWTLLLVAAFGLASLLTPSQGFFTRALAAIGIATAIAVALAGVAPGGLTTLRDAARGEAQHRTDATVGWFRTMTRRPEWRDATARSPQLDAMATQNEQDLERIPPWTARLLPALLALESLAALALAWALHQRLATVPAGPRLGSVREFRFNDQLVWGLAVGGTILVLPGFAGWHDAGLDLLVFFGALYLLRGVGVLSWVARGRWIGVLLIALTVFAPYLLAALALGVGVADTWMDWRGRVRPA